MNVNHLTLAAGASVNLAAFNLTVGGDVLATGATMSGSGIVYFCGGTHQLSGGVAGVVADCGAAVNSAGTVAIAGHLTTQGGAVFDVGSADATVVGDVGMYSGSRIKMTNASGKLTVFGTYDSNPGNDVGDTFMTDGVLELKGNLQALNGCCSQSFRAVGNHITRFSGSSAQTVSFAYADNFGRSTFGRVEFTGGNTVTLTNDMRVFGTVVVNNNSVVTGSGRTIFHIGALTTTAGTNLAGLASTQQQGGGTFPQIAGAPPATVELNGAFTATLPATPLTLPTNLALYGGAVLDLGANNLTVTGSLTLTTGSGSRLKMNNAAGVLTVHGNASFSALDAGSGDLTAGVFELRGNFTSGTYGQAFLATGSHLMRFAGTGPQSIYMQHTGGGQSQFASVEITNTVGVTPTSNFPIAGNLTQLGKLTITSVAVNVAGNIGLGNGSVTIVAGGALNRGGTCSIISGTPATVSGFSCP